ncbi:5-oxoprolinase subunit PxpA [Teredinibacter haidensis]|uniref:5-oxoprolinase subunit PxpA n=1 Tax=Teredinibacter haidensis TaxID=2731755 RepID=UPI000948DC1A|nr:5-oxoprolinase subunit PxpA [Teredinibacter haidensis]
MKLNCDLGEGLDQVDALIMPHIHMANIACGGHAGDELSMKRCISLALNYGVSIGAHPGYEDRANMGRKSIAQSKGALQQSFLKQVDQLQEICIELGTTIRHIKPHGALYNDMMRDPDIMHTIVESCAEHYPTLPLVIQATLLNDNNTEIAQQYSHYLMYEGFADRRYTFEGYLVSRTHPNALLETTEAIIEQAENLSHKGGVYAENGEWLPLSIDTLCVHSDTPRAVDALLAISQRFYQS